MEQKKDATTIDSQILMELVRVRMPFGKYKGRILCDLPETYLAWFNRKGFLQEILEHFCLFFMKSNLMDWDIF